MEKPKAHITKKKERIVDDLVRLMKEYPVVGILDMSGLPALQFQRIKAKLSDVLEFRMVKKRLMKIAIDRVKDEKKGIEQLKEKFKGIPALVFTKEDPFKLAKMVKKEVSAAPAKPGQEAPNDLVLSAGPTPFTPGPMIGELGAMGIKTKVESGKINVLEDRVLVGKGKVIDEKTADLMSKLGMEPMKIGFNLVLTYKGGEILLKDVLFVDEELYLKTLKQFSRESFDLAVYIEYACKETIERMISKAEIEAESVSSLVKLDEVKKEETKEVKVEEKVEQPEESKPEEQVEAKEEKQEEKTEEEQPSEPEVKEEPAEEVEEQIEEVSEKEPKKEEKLGDIKEGTKIGMKPGKEITREDMDLAAKQLQQIQDNLIKRKK